MNIYRFYGHYLPISFNYKNFGHVISEDKENKIFIVMKLASRIGIIYEFIYSDNKCEVKAKVKNKTHYSFIDEFKNSKDDSTFVRTFKNKKYYFEKGKILKEERINLSDFRKRILEKNNNNDDD